MPSSCITWRTTSLNCVCAPKMPTGKAAVYSRTLCKKKVEVLKFLFPFLWFQTSPEHVAKTHKYLNRDLKACLSVM